MMNGKDEGQEADLADSPGVSQWNVLVALGLASVTLCAEISDIAGAKLLTSLSLRRSDLKNLPGS